MAIRTCIPPLVLLALGARTASGQAARPATFRYVYRTGAVERYAITEEVTLSRQTANDPAVTPLKQTTKSISVRKTLSVAARRAEVSQTTRDSSSETVTPQGTSSQVIPPSTRTYTITDLGKVENVVRKNAAAGTREPFENLSFSLPERPVAPGAKWSETIDTYGLDGKPIAIRAASTLVRNVSHAGHPCAEIKVTFSGSFKPQINPPQPTATGGVSGELTYWFATDLGRETESDALLQIVIKATGPDGKTPVKATQQFKYVQTLVK